MIDKHITVLAPTTARAICACCLLAEAMKDCKRCEFLPYKNQETGEGIKAPIKALPDSNPTLSAA